MTIKSLLIGSAAAVVAASGAQAADAIVAADPEPVEYVQVCDTYGDGFFYIPGTETCLKFSGYVQWQSIWDTDNVTTSASGAAVAVGSNNDAQHSYEARLQIDAKNDSELGTVASTLRFTNQGSQNTGVADFQVDRAFMTIGDGNYWTVGLIGSPWDFSIVGEQNFLNSGATRLAVGYTAAFDGGTFSLYAVDDLANNNEVPDFIAKTTFTAGDIGVVAALAYDEDLTSGDRLGAKVNVSYMGFGAHVQWSQDPTNPGTYNTNYDWVVGLGYGFDATDKLNIALAGDLALAAQGVSGTDDYALSANFTYALAEGVEAALRLTHGNGDTFNTAYNQVRFRLKRSF